MSDRDANSPSADRSALTARLADLRSRIDAAGPRQPVTIVAVTKGFAASHVADAVACGLVDVGESYAQEALEKWSQLDARARGDANLHFIGRLQSNKVKALAPLVSLWQSVDRAEIAAPIAKWAPNARVLVQVNISGEPQKGGCAPEATDALVDRCRELGLHVLGLMGVAAADDSDGARRGFEVLRSLVDRLGLEVCSMGMTDDLDIAVAAGSTMVRIGSALFGPRPVKRDLRH